MSKQEDARIERLVEEKMVLVAENRRLTDENHVLEALCNDHVAQIASLQARIKRLERGGGDDEEEEVEEGDGDPVFSDDEESPF